MAAACTTGFGADRRLLFEKESSTYTYLLANVADPDKPAVVSLALPVLGIGWVHEDDARQLLLAARSGRRPRPLRGRPRAVRRCVRQRQPVVYSHREKKKRTGRGGRRQPGPWGVLRGDGQRWPSGGRPEAAWRLRRGRREIRPLASLFRPLARTPTMPIRPKELQIRVTYETSFHFSRLWIHG
ncbi:hypothetical protein GQ55_9G321100 [Panicum hallii var. hallii]|uniref:Uncharacterized protein n=1 Tax=Panicum hallii var. hallii TaxID=1504633 RepID=A0A2T7C849_9POAL|nr:hypothetical protein GQ55_9G321100 [Panicum hallii var. hallii]